MAQNWSSHAEWAILMITLIGGVYVMDSKMERQIAEVRSQVHAQTVRTDRLYEMFIELLKENKAK